MCLNLTNLFCCCSGVNCGNFLTSLSDFYSIFLIGVSKIIGDTLIISVFGITFNSLLKIICALDSRNILSGSEIKVRSAKALSSVLCSKEMKNYSKCFAATFSNSSYQFWPNLRTKACFTNLYTGTCSSLPNVQASSQISHLW